MAWFKRSVTDVINSEAPRLAFDMIANFLLKSFSTGSLVAGANTGNGVVLGLSATDTSVAESFTLTCTSGGASAVFSVVGSVSGALPSATVNTAYSDKVSFVIKGGSTDFVASDSFTFSVSASTSPWTSLYRDANNIHLSGAGYPSAAPPGPIFVTLKGDTDLMSCQGGTGYDSGSNLLLGTTLEQSAPVLETGFDFYCSSTPQSVRLLCVSGSGRYTALYFGFLNMPATTSQYPYPLCIGGTGTARYTSTSNLYQFWNQSDASSTRVQVFDGYNYIPSSTNQDTINSFPSGWLARFPEGLNVNGDVDMFPETLYGSLTKSYVDGKVFGDLEGVFAHTTADSTIIPESIIANSTRAFVVTPNTNDATELVSFELFGD